MTTVREGLLMGMGNPLLDITANDAEKTLKKYELEANNSILAEDKHKAMYDEIVQDYEVEYTAGGATQNTMRVIQWMLDFPNAVTFMGCVGKDKYGEILGKEAKSAGVNVNYMFSEKEVTGTCAVLLTSNGKNRSLCANLAAANLYDVSHLNEENNVTLMKKADFFYISGFFITVSPKSILTVASHASECNKIFSLNLSAPFISQFFMEPLKEIIPYTDIIFGNETEAETFGKEQKLGVDTISEIALKISEMPKVNKSRKRMVVITQGDAPIVVAIDGKVESFECDKIPSEKIIDTNGAGDAFVGGFLSQLMQGMDTKRCIKAGVYASSIVIQRSGVTLPAKSDFKY